MKTKIIYISGNELFDMADIRAAFEEVRNALGLDSGTVLFGVPVDNEDAGLGTQTKQTMEQEIEEIPVIDSIEEIPEPIEEETSDDDIIEETQEIISVNTDESIEEPAPKKRGRPRKVPLVEDDTDTTTDETTEDTSEKIIPIISVLSGKKEESFDEPIDEIQTEITEDTEDITTDIDDTPETDNEETDEPDLEKLLSKMKPLEEDIEEKTVEKDSAPEEDFVAVPNDINIDPTLQQLANEFAENQSNISTENKSSVRGKIGKLRNIFPFKQSKHKDQGMGDLFEWGGQAANDEDFSIPGFFTNAASKK